MKKDISFAPVTGVMIAIVPSNLEQLQDPWDVMIINKNMIDLENVMIVSKGYGSIAQKQKKTSTLRHFIEILASESVAKVEPIHPEVFPLTNEYWVSYYILDQVFDKKFVFVPETIQERHLIFIPEIERKGILHK